MHFKPLFLVFISVLCKLLKESLRQGGLRCCSLEICPQWWLCFTCVEEKLEQNLVRKPLLLTLMTTLLQCNIKLSFKFREVLSRSQVTFFLTNSVSTIRHRGITSLVGLRKQDKGTTREGKVQGSLRIGSCLTDKVLF